MTGERTTSETTTMLTVPEVAAYLKISPTTVWRHCVSGHLPAFRVGRQWRIERRDLERWIANLKDHTIGELA